MGEWTNQDHKSYQQKIIGILNGYSLKAKKANKIGDVSKRDRMGLRLYKEEQEINMSSGYRFIIRSFKRRYVQLGN